MLLIVDRHPLSDPITSISHVFFLNIHHLTLITKAQICQNIGMIKTSWCWSFFFETTFPRSCLWHLIINIPIPDNTSAAFDFLFTSKQVCLCIWLCSMWMFRWSTCGADKWVHTANVTLLWQSDTTPGVLLSPQGVSVCVCGGQARPPFHDKDTTFPALNVCFVRARERVMTRQWPKRHQWNSSSRVNPLSGI